MSTYFCRWVAVGFLFWQHVLSLGAAVENISDDPRSPFLIRSWQTAQGLPNPTIHAIAQTRDGYLWLATDGGLARFDGVNFRVFGLKDGLGSLHINTLLVDRQDALWIGTIGGGLSRLVAGQIKTFTTRDGLLQDSIGALAETAQGEVWVGTFQGLCRWRHDRFEVVDPRLGRSLIYGIADDGLGNVWVSTLHEGLWRYTDGTFFTNAGPAGYTNLSPYRLLVDDQKRLWVSSRFQCLVCCDHGQWSRYDTNQGLPPIVIGSLGQAPDGTIWAGSISRGLYYLQAGQFKAVRKKDGLPDEATLAVFAGTTPFLWVGSQAGGLSRIGPKKLSVYHVLENNEPDAAECLLRSVAQTGDGEIYVGTFLQKLYHQTGRTFERVMDTKPMNGYVYVEAMMSGRDGSLWWGAGPSVFQWQHGKMLTSCPNPPWLENDRVWSMCEDRAGSIWVGTYNGQCGRFKDGQFTPLKNLPNKPVATLVQTADEALWLGTFGGGLLRWQAGQLTTFTTKDGLGCNLIRALLADADGSLWIGTDGGGLTHYINGRFVTFTTAQGLISDSVVQILEDDAGHLWLGGNNGICRVSKAMLADVAGGRMDSIHSLPFGVVDGMASAECMACFNAALKTKSGELYFLTQKGIVVIDPRQQTNTLKLPDVKLEELVVEDRVLKKSEWAASEKSVHSAPEKSPLELKIPPGYQGVEFQYTGFNFDETEGIQFRSRLVGLDSDWSQTSRNRKVLYHYVPPGQYRFQVMACNSDGIWNPILAEVAFKVLPFFWQTVWFKLVVILTVICLAGGVIYYRERRRYWAQLQRVKQEQEQERMRIAHDLHDELGSQLTSIAYMGELASRDDMSPQAVKQQVGGITERVRQTMSTMSEVVWTINPKNDSLPNIVNFLCDYTQRFLAVTPVRWRLEADPEFPPLTIPAQSRHNLLMAAKETLNNSVRHAGATLIQLDIHVKNGWLEVRISDNGRGFEVSQARAGGNGLGNIQSRLESAHGRAEIISQTGQGTSIVLLLPLPEIAQSK